MAPKETTDVLILLRESCAELRTAAEGLTESQARQKPEPERWSVLDCVEHLVIVEGRTQMRLENSETAASPEDHQKEANILTMAGNRGTRFQAPEPVRPTGKYATLGEALAAFDAVRAKTIAIAEKHGAGLYSLGITHPVFGALNGTEAMFLTVAHSRRHADQIREVRAAVASQ
jgi:hypothetical protein